MLWTSMKMMMVFLCFTLLKVIGFFIMIFLLIAENQIVSLTVYFAEKVLSLYMQKCFWLQHIMIVHVYDCIFPVYFICI